MADPLLKAVAIELQPIPALRAVVVEVPQGALTDTLPLEHAGPYVAAPVVGPSLVVRGDTR